MNVSESASGSLSIVGSLSIPWERSDLGWTQRFLRTVVHTVLSPGSTLGRIDAKRLGPALAFNLWTGIFATCTVVLDWAILFETGHLPKPDARLLSAVSHAWLPAAIVLYVVGVPLLGAGIALMQGAVFHMTARTFGGRGKLAATLRASLYMASLAPIVTLLSLVEPFPIAGTAMRIAAFVISVFWGPWALFHIGKGVHGLRGGSAVLSVVGTVVAEMLAIMLLVAIGALAVYARALHGHGF